jgi:polynucleotide kinase-phosphatase
VSEQRPLERIVIPELSLVVLVGVSGSGKSTFARRHFKPTEVISSDFCRGLVSDDENDQAATGAAFEVLHFIGAKRLAAGRLTVVDATNVQPEARKPLVALARTYHCIPVAIVFDLPERLCRERNQLRSDRSFGAHVLRQQSQQLRRSIRSLEREGFRHVSVLSSPEEVDAVSIERQPLWNNRKHEHGPFDIIGDVHGCLDELVQLLERLGYTLTEGADGLAASHPGGRKAVFLGDLVDRGPQTPGVLRLVMNMTAAGQALCVPGNHDVKLMRKLKGRDVRITHGLAESLTQLDREPPEFVSAVTQFIDALVSHYVFDEGRLVVAHAGLREDMQGRGSGKVRDFSLFGETTGETDEFGLPVRYNWAADYRGRAMVVYGHTPVVEPEWVNRTINLDTGCVFGGKLTALRYPERELVSIPAARMYYTPAKPLGTEASTPAPPRPHEDLLDIGDVTGKRIVTTRLHSTVTIREENAAAALEVMSRFAINPKWLIYLPPTMSPSETSQEPGLLEHPRDAFRYYSSNGIARVVLQEKHMGSRAVLVVCRDESVARRRFGIAGEGIGACWTRTGRRFLEPPLEAALLTAVGNAVERSGLWNELATDWLCLDAELMPWSLKAEALVRQQYAAVGAAARVGLASAMASLERAAARGVDVAALTERYHDRARMADRYADVYRRYCWPVRSVQDLRLAPFHLLATERAVHVDKTHAWHLEMLARLGATGDPTIALTAATVIDLTDAEDEERGIRWWRDVTDRGGEGMVVKPFDFVARGRRGLVQPALKCRGAEYLRIIYGLEYSAPENLDRLRARGLSVKRSLALREFALGVEALERFVREEPLYRVHECVFGVLAMESEPVDPRL